MVPCDGGRKRLQLPRTRMHIFHLHWLRSASIAAYSSPIDSTGVCHGPAASLSVQHRVAGAGILRLDRSKLGVHVKVAWGRPGKRPRGKLFLKW